MKKALLLLFGGLALISASAGILSSRTFNRASADGATLIVDSKETITLGSFASTYDEELSVALNVMGYDAFINDHSMIVQYKDEAIVNINEERYLVKDVNFTNASDEIKIGNNKYAKADLEGKKAVFKFAPIEWALVSESGGYCTYISKKIILREQFNEVNLEENPYSTSTIRNVLNLDFKGLAFDDKDSQYLNLIDIGDNTKDYIDLPLKSTVGDEKYNDGSSDYVICSGIDLEIEDGRYSYWTKQPNQNDPAHVIALSKIADPNDETIGVRPMIKVKVKINGQGGGSVPSTPIFNINFTGNVPLLIVGFVLLAGGLTFIVIFIIKWSKKLKINPKFRNPWWYYLILGICVTVIIVGCNCYAYGTMLKLTTFTGWGGTGSSKDDIYGLYVSGTYLDDDDGSTDWDWADITHGIYALSKEGKVYHYIGNWPVGRDVIREEGEGSWTVKGNEVTITFPANWRRFSFESSPMTYKVDYKQPYWDMVFSLDYEVQFAEWVPPLVSNSGIYAKNHATAFNKHNPDGRAMYNASELGF